MATFTVAGSLIGSGIYLLPATLAEIGSISLFGWLIAAFGALLLAGNFCLIFLERSTDNGMAAIVGDGLGPFWGFQASMFYWLSIWVANIAIALAVVGYLSVFLPALADPGPRAFATCGVIWLLTLVASAGPRAIGNTHGITLALGLVPLIVAGIAGWIWFDPQVFADSWNVSAEEPVDAVFDSVLIVLWAFIGVECAAMIARMVHNPRRNIPLATMGGVGIATLVYISSSTAIFGIVSAAELAQSSAPFALAVERIMGPAIAGMVAICAIAKASGTLGGWVLVSGECSRWSAASGYLPRWMAHVGPRGTPVRALLTMGVIMSIAVFATASDTLGQQFEMIISMTVVLVLVTYIMAAGAMLRLSRDWRPIMKRLAHGVGWPSILFCLAVLATSDTILLLLAGAVALVVGLAWLVIRGRTQQAAAYAEV